MATIKINCDQIKVEPNDGLYSLLEVELEGVDMSYILDDVVKKLSTKQILNKIDKETIKEYMEGK